MTTIRTRSFPLEDIAVARSGDGRTVEAFAAVFDTPAEVRDADGHYEESISRTAFDKSLRQQKRADGSWKVGVFYNHGRTLTGEASDRASIPLGTPLHIEATSRGLLTVTRYNRTPLADDVLEAIQNGDITGQSFSGRFLQSEGHRRGQKLGPDRSGRLPRVTRAEIALAEYGPAPMPVYADAEIVGVRHLIEQMRDDEIVTLLSGISEKGTAAEQPLAASPALRSAIRWARVRADITEVIRNG